MFLKDMESRPLTKFRIAELAGAMVLGFFSLILGISEIGALFNGYGILFGLGGFFVDSLGILAFGIPIYLFYAAFLLAQSAYRPDRIFILTCALFPFLTLAIGFVFLRDFNTWADQFVFLYWIGKGGFNFFIILLTIIEGIIIVAFSSLLFSRNHKKKAYQNIEYDEDEDVSFEQAEQSTKQESEPMPKPWWFSERPLRRLKPSSILLPSPILRQSSPRKSLESENIYGDSSFKEREPEKIDIENIRLPDIKPLSSVTAIDKLESLSHIPRRNLGNEGIANNEVFIEDAVIETMEEPDNRRFSPKVQDMDDEPNRLNPESKFPKSSWGSYHIPVEGLLNQYPEGQYWIIDQATKEAAMILKETLEEFHIQGEITGIRKGPVLTMFEILPGPGVKISKIVNLQDNIALRLGAVSVRILAPIPGKHAVGIEIPNSKRNMVSFGEIIQEILHRKVASEGELGELPVVLGKDITGEAQVMDLVQMPHLLIAGAASSGKSVFVHGLILSILYQQSPGECRLIMINPKIKELKCYNDIPHLLTPVIMEPKRAFQVLQYCIFEMERRYACLDSLGVRDIRNYNKRIKERGIGVDHLPYMVVVIDEFADLMVTVGKEFESTLANLAAMSRTVGIHLVLATQRLSIDVITGLIKANIPSHIAFMVASKMDSRIIMDMAGAEKLLGKGDMLYVGAEAPIPIRMQGAFVSEEEVKRVVEYVKTLGNPDYIDDELF